MKIHHNSDNYYMGKKQLSRVIISGGGTGGHIFPAVSIANALRRRYPGVDILFVGAENRMEMQRVPQAGYNIVGLPVAGFDRKRLWRNFSVLAKLFRSMRKAGKVIDSFQPQVAIGVGGYASGPTLKQAQKKGIPTLLQEQNGYAGVTNKMLGRKAGAICVAYDGMDRFFPADKIIMTGNPVRAALLENTQTRAEAKKALGFDSDKPLVLVVGGSLGARTLNSAMALGLDDLEAAGVQLLWQTGAAYASSPEVEKARGRKGIKAMPFISDMAQAYKAADLVVSRAGAGTISELQLLGKATILVPSPNVAENHQYKNARALSDRNAAELITDDRAPQELVKRVLELVADEKALEEMEQKISLMALRDADEKIVDAIEALVP